MKPPSDITQITCDVLVIGAGAAGLSAAMAAREAGANVLVISATKPETASATAITQVAGAFISAALGIADPRDNEDIHFEDTVIAGRCLSEQPLVWHYTHNVRPAVERLQRCGVAFKRDEAGRLLQFHSPGHRYPRTLAFGPGAGTSLSRVMVQAAEGMGVQFLPNLFVTRLLHGDGVVCGAAGLQTGSQQPVVVRSKAIVMATGGAGLLYPRTGIPPATAGAGFAIALAAGATLIDMEFVQWYPTALAEDGKPNYLLQYDYFLSHGARLLDAEGDDLLARSSLSDHDVRNITRDQLSVALGRAMRDGLLRDGRAWLDLSRCPATIDHPVLANSPYVQVLRGRLGQKGGGLYVAPTAHYFMGGVVADPIGRTEVPGLYVCGEAVGGVHGANRLQGNSLTDGLVGGHSAGLDAARVAREAALPEVAAEDLAALAEDLARAGRTGGEIPFSDYLETLRRLMVTRVGLVRDRANLLRARDELASLAADLNRVSAHGPQQRDWMAILPAVVTTAQCIIESSLAREASCGAFYLDGAPPPPDDGSHIYHVSIRQDGSGLVVGRREVDRSIRPDLGGVR